MSARPSTITLAGSSTASDALVPIVSAGIGRPGSIGIASVTTGGGGGLAGGLPATAGPGSATLTRSGAARGEPSGETGPIGAPAASGPTASLGGSYDGFGGGS